MAVSEALATQMKMVKTDIERELGLFFDHKIAEASKIDAQYKRLLTEMKKYYLNGGKRLRPFLAYLGYRIGGGSADGKEYQRFIQAAAVLEMYHQFALIHDDVMDRDTRRHNAPNLQGVYERFYGRSQAPEVATHHAQNASLLAGDIALGFSFEMLMNAPLESEVRARLQRELLKLHFSLAGGQFLDDVAVLHKDMNIRKIRKIYYYKTARYTVVFPLQFGGLMAGANDTILTILERYGQHAGIAFQIIDDLLGMFGTTKEIGKSVVTDLREGKRTILMYYGQKFADDTQARLISRAYGNPSVTTNDLKLVRRVLSENGAKAKTVFMAQAEAEAAKQAIGKLALPGELPSMFIELTDYIINRKY